MTADRCNPSILTASLTFQISEAEHRLRKRRRFVQIRGAALGRTLHQRMTAPASLLWAGGMGFLMGEITRPQIPKSRSMDHSPDSGHSFFETVLNLIQLVTWVRAFFTALPGKGTPPSSPLDSSVQTPDRSQGNSQEELC